MPVPKSSIEVIQEWLVKADNDLTAAAQILKLGATAPTDTICFHAQQCVEKCLKALLVFRAVPFPKTPNIRVLMTLVPPRWRPPLEEDVQDQFTDYASVIRYPEAGLDISPRLAHKAVALARRVRKEVRRKLPKTALRRKRK